MKAVLPEVAKNVFLFGQGQGQLKSLEVDFQLMYKNSIPKPGS